MRNARRVIEAAQAATGLSQVGLAAALGVDPSALRRWLSGARAMQGPALRLCRVLAAYPDAVGVAAGCHVTPTCPASPARA